MGSGKWFFLAGVGAGVLLTLRLSEKQIESIKAFIAKVSQAENLNEAKRVTREKLNNTLRKQGVNLVDYLAEQIKKQLSTIDLNSWSGGFPENAKTDTSSTRSTDCDDENNDNVEHIIIDGKIVS